MLRDKEPTVRLNELGWHVPFLYLRETLEIQRCVLGPKHPDTASTAYDLADALAHSGRSDEAISVLREAIDHGLDPAADLAISKDPDLKSLGKDRPAARTDHVMRSGNCGRMTGNPEVGTAV